jgi:hypothetical protein
MIKSLSEPFIKTGSYLRPMLEGRDRKISLRAVLAVAFSINFISISSHAVYKWDIGQSFEGLSLILGIEAGLIVSLLGLTAIQNIQDRKINITAGKDTGDLSKDASSHIGE